MANANIYSFLESLNNQTLFIYILIIIACMYLFQGVIIGLNVVCSIIIAIILISYFYNKRKASNDLKQEQIEMKKDIIKPKLYTIDTSKDDIIDFLFSIQDFYMYNQQAYEEMIDNLEVFFQIYSQITLDVSYCSYYYQIAESKKENALNSLHSIIFKLPNNRFFIDKYDRAHERLETILLKYINQMYSKCKRDLDKNGYDISKRHIDTGPVGYNNYFVSDTAYEFY